MKKLMNLLVLVVVLAMLAACGSSSRGGDTPTDKGPKLDGTQAVYNAEKGQYEIEEGAVLKIGVDNDAFGNAIVELWNKTHPEFAGKVIYQNVASAGAADRLATEQDTVEDVILVIDGEVGRNAAHMLAFEGNLEKLVKENSIESFFMAGNRATTVYAPIAYDGLAFVWNKTMLESLGLDVTDANGDNLPDAFDTWEEIFALSKSYIGNRPTVKTNVFVEETNANGEKEMKPTGETKETKLNVVFPLALTEPWSGYMMYSSAGWDLFADGDVSKPGYDTPEFKAGWDFLLAAKEAQISVEESGVVTPGSSMGWRWDDVLNGNNLAPFGLVGTWMNVEGWSKEFNNEYVVSKLPTWKGNPTTPFVKTKGYVINGYTKYRSAASELVRLLYSKEGLQAMVDNSSYAPSLVEGSALTPTLAGKPVQEQFMSAFVENYPEPQFTLPNNPAKTGMDTFYYGEGKVLSLAPLVWDGTKTVDEAIAELIKVTQAQFEADNVAQ